MFNPPLLGDSRERVNKNNMLKEIIDKLTSIYNEQGDIEVTKSDECGGIYDVLSENIKVLEWEAKDGSTQYRVEL